MERAALERGEVAGDRAIDLAQPLRSQQLLNDDVLVVMCKGRKP